MQPIGLTGHADAQAAVALQLAALITERGLQIAVLLGVNATPQAYAIHHEGGELWQCGPYSPLSQLVGQIDRVLPGTTFEDIAPQVQESLAALCAKTNLTGEPA